MKPSLCDPPPPVGETVVVAHMVGKNGDGYDVHVPYEFTLTIGRNTTAWKIFFVVIIIALSILICRRYRHSLADTWRSFRGSKNVGMPAYAYQNVSTDQVGKKIFILSYCTLGHTN